MSTKLTCLSCRLMFDSSTEQRTHFKTDFHLFNLKRKKAGLAPISQEQFDKVVQQILIENTIENNNEGDNGEEIEKNDELSDDDVEQLVLERMNDPNTVNLCLFCDNLSEKIEDNLLHMKNHGFFVPLKEYVYDIGELIKYLSVKVNVAHICILCDYTENVKGRIFKNTQATQAHMRDLSHCRFEIMENTFEYEKLYNFDLYEEHMRSKYVEEEDGLLLPSNKIIVHKDIQLYNRPSHEVQVNEEEAEEEKQLLALKKNRKNSKNS